MAVPLTDVGMIGKETSLRVNQQFCLQHAPRNQMGILYKSRAQRTGISVCLSAHIQPLKSWDWLKSTRDSEGRDRAPKLG